MDKYTGLMAIYFIKRYEIEKPGPEVVKKISCSTQLSMKFFLLINVKMPTIVNILTFLSKKNSFPCIQCFTFLSKQFSNLINTHNQLPAFGTRAVQYDIDCISEPEKCRFFL